LRLRPSDLTFYDFPGFSDLAELKSGYRKALDEAGTRVADTDLVVEEGVIAFSLNIDLSCAVQDASLDFAATAAE
jgi:heme oxygenase